MANDFKADEVITAEEYRRRMSARTQRGTRGSKDYEAIFDMHLRASDVIPYDSVETQVRFHPKRRWRFDFCIPSMKIALEVDGGEAMRTVTCAACGTSPAHMTLKNGRSQMIRLGGGHHTPQGFRKNREKWNEAAILGWVVQGATGTQVESGEAIGWFERLYQMKMEAQNV